MPADCSRSSETAPHAAKPALPPSERTGSPARATFILIGFALGVAAWLVLLGIGLGFLTVAFTGR